jgi:hypothetical protein
MLSLLLLQDLQLATCVEGVDLRIIQRDIHVLHPSHIRRDIDVKAVRHERATRVRPGEEVIAAAGSVVATPGRDIVDGPVDREEDRLGEIRVRAIVGPQVAICVLFWSGLWAFPLY